MLIKLQSRLCFLNDPSFPQQLSQLRQVGLQGTELSEASTVVQPKGLTKLPFKLMNILFAFSTADASVTQVIFLKTRAVKFESTAASLVSNGPEGRIKCNVGCAAACYISCYISRE